MTTADNWQLERRMTPRQYATILELLGLNKAQAGRFLGVSERTSHRYYDGKSPIPEAYALLLRSMQVHGETPLVPKAPKWVRVPG